MSFIFKKKNQTTVQPTQLNKLVDMLQNTVNSNHAITTANARSALSMESIRDEQFHSLNSASNELTLAIEVIATELGLDKVITQTQVAAGAIAGILAGDYRGFLSHKGEFPAVATENMSIVPPHGINDAMANRSFALEAYDERENRNAVIYSIAYNMQSARQDEFGETFFPTLVITPDNVGFGITVNLMMVYDAIERKITGTVEDYKKKNIIRAVADATVLRKEQTKIVPVWRAQAADKFVDATIIPNHNITLEGEVINTSPLAFGKKLDLLGLSQTDTLLAGGIMDQTDSLDPYITVQNIYAKVGADILKFNVSNLPLSNFTYSTQNLYRVQNLNFQTTSILINVNTKALDGSALVDLAPIVANDLIVRLEVQANGTTNIETGETVVFGNSISVYSVQDSSGNILDLASAPASAIVAAFNNAVLLGYDVLAYRTNMNRRQRGQLIDVTKYTQLYDVPLRSPIATIHPINVDGQTDTSDIQALITTTRIRTSNEAVTALINTSQLLSEYVDARDVTGLGPDILGVGRFFVKPTYFQETIDMNLMVDSIKSHERSADIQAALVNKIRDLAFRMYRDSEYKAAADALAGGISAMPCVIIGTDPVIARYLTVTGDLRTLGSDMDFRIVSSLDYRIAGKIFIAFSTFDEGRNVSPNPMNFGNLIWAPELVLTANISRANTISKETVVQPRYLFVTHSPIMSVLEVENIPQVLNKVPLNFHQV